MRKGIITSFLVLTLLFVGAIGGYLIFEYLGVGEVNNTTELKVIVEENSISVPVEQAYDAVVFIQNFSGTNVVSSGTGFIYKKDSDYGYILTNYHVIEDGSRHEAIFTSGREVDMEFLGGDPYVDIAVLRVPLEYIVKTIIIGNSGNNKIGDTVFTIGAPLGINYIGTVTKGILSGKDRMVSLAIDSYDDNWIAKVMQTDAAINPGNSGGPLLDIHGRVIGINSMKLVQDKVEGMGFAIPIEDVMEYIHYFENGEKIIRPFLGVSMIDADDEYYLYLADIDLDVSMDKGVVIEKVKKDSPADKAGLRRKDVIVKIGNVDVDNRLYLKYYLYKYEIGEVVKLTYYREGELFTADIMLNKQLN